VICATNQPLREMIAQGRFREDLLYRINTVELHIPPLRERGDDIDLLTDHFLAMYARKYRKNAFRLLPETRQLLRRYTWPGNVRELQHTLERAVILCEDEIISPSDFQFPQLAAGQTAITLNLDDNEKRLITEALEKYKGNISKAAQALGLTRAALYRRMEKHQIEHTD